MLEQGTLFFFGKNLMNIATSKENKGFLKSHQGPLGQSPNLLENLSKCRGVWNNKGVQWQLLAELTGSLGGPWNRGLSEHL